MPNSSKGLDPYRGKLRTSEIADGMNAAIRNAKRLFEDASLLLDAARYSSAAALAILSIEESGKPKILRLLAMSPDVSAIQQAWREYRSHRSKNTAWIVHALVLDGAKDLASLREATNPKGEHTALLDQLKQIALYTDCLGKAHWSEPVEVIDEDLARSLVRLAEMHSSSRIVTVKEVELWIEHLKPVYGRPLDEMKTALENWFEAMCENGIEKYDMDKVRDFVRGPEND